MKKSSTAVTTQSRIFLGRDSRSDWIWEIATAGTACWTKQARYSGSVITQNARTRVTGHAELGLFATGIDHVANSTVRAPKG